MPLPPGRDPVHRPARPVRRRRPLRRSRRRSSTTKPATPSTTKPATPGSTQPAATHGSSGAAVAPHSVDSAKDQALADRIGLTLADFPAGWQATSAAPSDGLDLSVPECTGFHDRLAGTNAVARTTSADFAKAGQRVSSSVDVLAVQPEAGAVVDMAADPALHRCLGAAFVAAARASITSSAPIDAVERNGRRPLHPASGRPERRTAGGHPSDVAGGHGRPLRRRRGVPRRPDGCPHRLRIAPDPVRRTSRRAAAPHTGHPASSLRRQHAVSRSLEPVPTDLAVPGVGLEPTRPCGQPVLSRSRTPIPPSGPAQTLPVAMSPAARSRAAVGGWAGRGAGCGRRLSGPWRGRCCSGASWT